jgi:transcriptional regulator with XRE-family HTH domain
MPEDPLRATPEGLGRRIAAHRAKLGWTQQELAGRVAISRVALSHLEAGMSDPGERTVALLASVFKVAPHDLVAGTSYPTPRAERLPLVVATHTEVDLQLALLDQDLAWAALVDPELAVVQLEPWTSRLTALAETAYDPHEAEALGEARTRLRRELGELRARPSTATPPAGR